MVSTHLPPTTQEKEHALPLRPRDDARFGVAQPYGGWSGKELGHGAGLLVGCAFVVGDGSALRCARQRACHTTQRHIR